MAIPIPPNAQILPTAAPIPINLVWRLRASIRQCTAEELTNTVAQIPPANLNPFMLWYMIRLHWWNPLDREVNKVVVSAAYIHPGADRTEYNQYIEKIDPKNGYGAFRSITLGPIPYDREDLMRVFVKTDGGALFKDIRPANLFDQQPINRSTALLTAGTPTKDK